MNSNTRLADKAPWELQASDYVIHLWNRRMLLGGLTFAVLFLTWLGIFLFQPNVFESHALIMVREQSRMNAYEEEKPGIHPPAFVDLFQSDEMIEFVRQQYNARVENGTLLKEDGHKVIKTPLEKLHPWFRVKSGTTIDTTIATKFSPVIEISARGISPGQSRALAELWTQRILNKYGNLLNEEAQFMIESNRKKTEKLKEELAGLTLQREALVHEQKMIDLKAASKMRQLTYAPIPQEKTHVKNDVLGYNMNTGPRESVMTIDETARTGEPGLWEQKTELEVRLAGFLAIRDGNDAEVLSLQSKLVAVESLAASTEQELAELNKRSSELNGEIAGIEVLINRCQYSIRLNSALGANAENLEHITNPNGSDEEKFGTLRVLANPVSPQLKIWPIRTLIAGIAAAAAGILFLLIFSGELYVRQAIIFHARSQGVV